MDPFNLYDQVFDDRFDKAYLFLKEGLTGDIEQDIKTLEQTIETTSIYQGNDWVGRGDISLAKTNATIAAAQTLVLELREQAKK